MAKREEDRDAYGRLVAIREYTGTSPNFTLYATTNYTYDVLGNLVQVTDAAGNVTGTGYDTLSRKTSMTDLDMGYWTYDYDANGNLTSQTDAKGQTIVFFYDALNRLTNKQYPSGPDVVYTYDELSSSNPKGRLTTISDSSGTTKFFYDMLGRTTRTVKTVDGVDYTTDSTYDAMGRIESITYPDAGRETVYYGYNTGGNLWFVVGTALSVQYSNYNALGQAGAVTYGNGATTVYQYHPLNNRLSSITTNSLGQGRQNLSYAYDNVGNIRTITDLLDPTRTQTFQYDDLHRILQAQSTAYGTLTYNYDAIGNLTYNSQVGSYSYPPPGYARPHAVTQAGANSYSYDLNGNMTGKNAGVLTYDYENRLTSLVTGGTTTTFVYDAAGGRAKKTSSAITTLYIGKLYECTSGVCTKHIFAGGNRIVTKKPTGTYYYHTDHLGSSSVVTDASEAKVEEIYYYPFGQTRVNSGSVNLHHKYTGQEEDAETGLYFYGARYYDPAIGRFISADTIVPDPTNPQALNRYSYVLNNPLIFPDPTGHSWLSDIGHEIADVWHDIERSRVGQTVIQAAATIVGAVYGGPPGAALAAASVNYAFTEDFKSALISGATAYVTFSALQAYQEAYPSVPASTSALSDPSMQLASNDITLYKSPFGDIYPPLGPKPDTTWEIILNASKKAAPYAVGAAAGWGIGLLGGGSAEAGVGSGGAVQATSGVGIFGGGSSGTNFGGFTSTGGFAGRLQSNQFVYGAAAGLGAGPFITNATSAIQLMGPFDTWSLNLSPLSLQLAVSGETWIASGSVGWARGFDFSRYITTTTTASELYLQ